MEGSNNKRISIGLVMIMKDESKVILRCLESVYRIIDRYTIVDTGSSDLSKKMVSDFFESKKIPGEIHDFKYNQEDYGYLMFDQWRNLAIEKAKGKTDFCFTIDADEKLALPENFKMEDLRSQLMNTDLATVDLHLNETVYTRRAFWRSSKPFRYFCPVHEVLICDEPTRNIHINNFHVNVSSDGASWSGDEGEKYMRHAKSLLKHIEKTGEEPRAVFYLAQSYRDSGEAEKAIEWYDKRVSMMSGYEEERYCSQLQIARLKWELQKPVSEVADEFMKCFELDDFRAEHILGLKTMYERNWRPKSAAKIGEMLKKYIGKNPYPKRSLFIEPSAYNYHGSALLDTYNILCSTQSDINEHLPTIRKYAEKCGHVTEMGVRWAVSTYALLASRPEKMVSYDINYHPAIDKAISIAEDEGVDFRFIQNDVLNVKIENTDLLFIDTIHEYGQLSKELSLHSERVGKYIIFHDTETFADRNEFNNDAEKKGLRPAIEEFLAENKEWGIVDLFKNNNGLCVIERRVWGEDRICRFSDWGQNFDDKKEVNDCIAEVDVCIISNAQTDELKRVTERGIETLMASEKNIRFNIFIVESNTMVKYNFPNTKTIYPSIPFNYNGYLNMARSEGNAPYVFLANNDLSYEKGWASAIIYEMERDKDLMSASPFCPQTQSKNNFPDNIYFGYQIRRELAGWAIFQQRKIYEQINNLDEGVEFWYSDNIYADQLELNEIKHALVTKSIVHHHDGNIGATGTSILDDGRRIEFTSGQYLKYAKAKEKLMASRAIPDFYA